MSIKIEIQLEDGRALRADLFEEIAPITVKNFLKLVDENFYNGLIFHRVIPNFMIQGGGMNQALEEKRCASIKGEFASNGIKNDLKHTLGVLSMARTQVMDSASSQFFICVADTPHLDGDYAAFGKLSDKESEQVAIDISKVQTTRIWYYSDVPYTPIIIKQIVRI